MTRRMVIVVTALGVACGSAPARQKTAVVRAFVTRAPKDTVRFTAPAIATPCIGGIGRGLLIRGSTGGNGAIAWLRTADSLAPGTWPLLQRGDTVSPRGATVGVRFMLGDIAHGVALDSGDVTVTSTHPAVTLLVRGAGLAVAAAGRVVAEVAFDSVPVQTDTVSCRAHP